MDRFQEGQEALPGLEDNRYTAPSKQPPGRKIWKLENELSSDDDVIATQKIQVCLLYWILPFVHPLPPMNAGGEPLWGL